MTDIFLDTAPRQAVQTRTGVDHATRAWFIIAALGHWLFLAYILAVFYPPIAEHGLSGLEGMHLPSGFVEGDTAGNVAAVAHVLLAAIIIGGGPLQLVPAIRRRWPRFHRILGRSYLVAAVISAVGGLWMVWTRGTVGNLINHIGISLDGVLILVFSGLALYHAMARRISTHRRFALRLFMVASAVWFFRVGLMAWVMMTGGWGIDFETFTGPFIWTLGFAQYLVPLAMLEWYFRLQAGKGTRGEAITYTTVLVALTGLMALGIFAATMGLWLPRMG